MILEDRIDEIKHLYYNEGMTLKQIREKYGVSHASIYRLANKYNFQLDRDRNYRVKVSEYKNIEKLYKQGFSLSYIAKKYNCNAETIRYVLTKINIRQYRCCGDYNSSIFKKEIDIDNIKIRWSLCHDIINIARKYVGIPLSKEINPY